MDKDFIYFMLFFVVLLWVNYFLYLLFQDGILIMMFGITSVSVWIISISIIQNKLNKDLKD